MRVRIQRLLIKHQNQTCCCFLNALSTNLRPDETSLTPKHREGLHCSHRYRDCIPDEIPTQCEFPNNGRRHCNTLMLSTESGPYITLAYLLITRQPANMNLLRGPLRILSVSPITGTVVLLSEHPLFLEPQTSSSTHRFLRHSPRIL